ncbi:hypothetical protein AB0N92_30315 [Streptomyces sp. NPDC093248]|uniref:hypothetical protein n=1 Tax=Streptomyces sp. NPDC093248 TaxID=3155072 RepID=UPI0034370497
MAWDEWEQLKGDALQRAQGQTHMRLNHISPDSGGTANRQGDLRVNQTDLAGVGDAAYDLYQAFQHDSDLARINSLKAAGGLASEGFEIGSALDTVAQHWVDQARTLLDATAHISNHLDYTKGAHAGDEVYISGTLSGIATLEKGFDERKGS